MIAFVKALWYAAWHPFDPVHFTVVRRYVDAQGHFIGELYEGDGRDARMIGASCDNWPFNADVSPLPGHPSLCWRKDFLAPLPVNTLRVGAMEPRDNEAVQSYVASRQLCPIRITILNRFVEHVLEADHVR